MHIPKTTTSLRNRTEILITHPLLIGYIMLREIVVCVMTNRDIISA